MFSRAKETALPLTSGDVHSPRMPFPNMELPQKSDGHGMVSSLGMVETCMHRS